MSMRSSRQGDTCTFRTGDVQLFFRDMVITGLIFMTAAGCGAKRVLDVAWGGQPGACQRTARIRVPRSCENFACPAVGLGDFVPRMV